jgi:hypothetical protein
MLYSKRLQVTLTDTKIEDNALSYPFHSYKASPPGGLGALSSDLGLYVAILCPHYTLSS